MSVTNSLTVTDCQTVTCQESSLCSLFVRYVWINVLHIELVLSPLVPLTEQINVSLVYWFRGQNNTAQMKNLWRAPMKAVHKWLPTNLSELKQCCTKIPPQRCERLIRASRKCWLFCAKSGSVGYWVMWYTYVCFTHCSYILAYFLLNPV